MNARYVQVAVDAGSGIKKISGIEDLNPSQNLYHITYKLL
jgi:hypothetical protein